LAIAVTVAACGGGEAATTTTTAAPLAVLPSSLVLSESGAPQGTEFVASLSWQQVRTGLEEIVEGGVVEELESVGLSDASVSVFLSPALIDVGDLAADGLLAVSAALAFGDGAGAESALEIIEGAAMVYAGAVDAMPRPFDVDNPAEGAVGLVVTDPSFPGGAAAVAWVEGAVVRISFAQGGDPTRDAQTLAKTMTEMEP
jgi:hypothetical protein